MEEIWKPVSGFEGYYEVSSLGNVRSVSRTIVNCKGVRKYKKGIILKPKIEKHGYYAVNLKCSGRSVYKRIHSLVAEAFIDNYENKKTVNHISGIKSDNSVSNLEWNTYAENSQHAEKEKLTSHPSGANYSGSKSVVQLDMDGNFIKEYGSLREAARNTTATSINISFCCRGKYSQSGGYKWEYKSDYEKKKQ
nr:NUMOD4 domain-containing protein [uncultured Draconibacterium sp.]